MHTRLVCAYWDSINRSKSWLKASASVAGSEIAKDPRVAGRYGLAHLLSRDRWKGLHVPTEAMSHWSAADKADLPKGGHSDETANILVKYADTEEKQNMVLESLEESLNVVWYRFDSIGRDAIAASQGAKVPNR